MQWHREDDRRVVLRDPAELAESLPILLDVLDDIESAYQVKASIGEWEVGNFAEHRATAAGLQVGEGGPTDVDEGRTGNGESRAQARADFESRWCRGRKCGEERPGVEALWRNHVTRRPEGVVETSVGVNGQARRVLRTSCRHGASDARDRCPRSPVPTEITLS